MPVGIKGRRLVYAPLTPSLVRAEVQRLDRAHEVTGYGVHAHDFFEIVVFDAAGGVHLVDGAAEPICKGQAWMLRPGVSHDLGGLGDAQGWLVVAGPEALGLPAGVGDVLPWPSNPLLLAFQQVDGSGRPRPLRLSGRRLRQWLGWLMQMRDETIQARLGYQHAVKALLHLLLIDAARDCSTSALVATDPLVERALAVVDERFRGPLSLADVARLLTVTPGHLTETVRRRTGRPLGEWILQRRLSEARTLLGETNQPIGFIAVQTGFTDVGHFSRQFRKHHGVSPSAWRAAVSAPAARPDQMAPEPPPARSHRLAVYDLVLALFGNAPGCHAHDMTKPTITTVTSGLNGLLSNTHLIEAPGGTVVVDPPMLLSDARAVRERLLQLGQPLAAFVYTHPHPDHINGATEIRGDQDVPVYATPETDLASRESDGPKRAFWAPIYPDDYPPVTTFATVLVGDSETVDVAGLQFTVHDIGAGECAAAALWIAGDDAFVGDLVYSHAHPWLFEARTHAWLAQLEHARPLLKGKRLHVGHGAAGGVLLIDEQARYIRAYQTAVQELCDGKPFLDDAGKAELLRRMEQVWPGAPLGDLVVMSADPVAAELLDA